MISTITVNGQATALVALPSGGFKDYAFDMTDAVAIIESPFTGQTQAQKWPGADRWTGTMTLPGLDCDDAPDWKAFLAQMRGRANAVQLGDPLYVGPRGDPFGTPTCPLVPVDAAGSEVLHTIGWTPGKLNLLRRWDYLQIGYRLHAVLDPVNSDNVGNAAIAIYPSLREAPAASAPVILANPRGLFRLGSNKRTWSASVTRLSQMSFQITEYR